MTYVEYRVRPVTRFVVTRFEAPCDPSNVPNNVPPVGRSSTKGEFDNEETAHAVAYALAKHDHERLGYPLGDERIKYPEPIAAHRGQGVQVLSGGMVVASPCGANARHDVVGAIGVPDGH